MFCSQCGTKNDVNAAFCTQCGTALKGTAGAGSAAQQQPVQQPMQQPMQPAPVYPTNGTTVVVNSPAAAAPAGGGAVGYVPSSHLFLGIISTFCCGCFPLGLISLICAIITMNRVSAGQLQAAAGSSRQAALWGWIAIILGLIMWVIWVLWLLLFGGLAVLQGMSER